MFKKILNYIFAFIGWLILAGIWLKYFTMNDYANKSNGFSYFLIIWVILVFIIMYMMFKANSK